MDELSGKIPPISGPDKNDPIQNDQKQKPSSDFKSYMNDAPKQNESSPTKAPSPLDLTMQKPLNQGPPSMESILGQMKTTSSALGDVQKKLQTKNLKLKASQKYLLRNKLGEANDHINQVSDKLGAPKTRAKQKGKQNPIGKFIGLLDDGQNQLTSAQKMLEKISSSKKPIDPAEMLLVQVKLSKASQALEYSSVLLSKAIESMKMLFNVQI